MARTKYPINKEFFPLTRFTPPINRFSIQLSRKAFRVPKFLRKDPALKIQTLKIPAYREGEIELLVLTPKGIEEPSPCLIYIHGGGFVFGAAPAHYKRVMIYAKEVCCKVVFVQYRLAPEYPFPYPPEDCYAAVRWVFDHAGELGIDPQRVGIGGDSAGGTLTVDACMMLRDREDPWKPLFQMLIYPFLDDRNCSESYRRYTDTPMWNSSMSCKVTPLVNPDPSATPLAYQSPAEAERFDSLPPAYIEVAEFDPLHDDGILFAGLLQREGIDVLLYETEGTMHGYDTRLKAPTTQEMIARRVDYMRQRFGT